MSILRSTVSSPVRTRRLAAGTRWPALALFALLLAGCAPKSAPSWKLTDITGYLPDLQLDLTNAERQPVTALDLRGKVVLLYFGYAHCPDVCPMTLGRLATAVQALGESADDVRIVFLSVDPIRDTPAIVAQYARAFSPQGLGLTGPPATIEALAKRFRVAYQAEKPDRGGNYLVMHSKAVFVFDRQGRARLMGTDTDPATAFTHDLKQLLAEAP
ncbi:MAG: SCO family protein [Opitutales bacterium]